MNEQIFLRGIFTSTDLKQIGMKDIIIFGNDEILDTPGIILMKYKTSSMVKRCMFSLNKKARKYKDKMMS
jgi:hypothetical protein